ncbi:hypothetical protein M0R45_029993 [Rubus argutus]|uniref:Uncharacterized protein n=1 Tax=Rubus argutus TaxID=59490 RepID=A0AAW1WBX5_RUBAR
MLSATSARDHWSRSQPSPLCPFPAVVSELPPAIHLSSAHRRLGRRRSSFCSQARRLRCRVPPQPKPPWFPAITTTSPVALPTSPMLFLAGVPILSTKSANHGEEKKRR